MTRRVLVSLAFAFALRAAAAPPAKTAPSAPAPQVPDIPYRKFVLKNGLTLLVHEDHKAPIAAFNVWYHVGSKNEKPGKTGFAHLFEHLMFNGSESYNDDYFKAIEPAGATDYNGTTNEDRTNYFENVPVTSLDRILWLESDRMGHLVGAIDKPRLDEQRGVVQNEKRQDENEPYGKVEDVLPELSYPKGHPYSWSVIGSMEDLNAASLEDVKEWFQTYYGAANATIVVAGDVKADEIRAKVERYFGDIPSGPPLTVQDSWVAKRTGEQRPTMQDRVPQARIYQSWNVPQYGAPDLSYLSLARQVLGGGRSSRLYERLVYQDRLATDVSVSIDDREIGSQLNVTATAQPGGDLAALEKAMNEEREAFLKDGPTAEELERAKTQIRAGFVRGIERIGGFGGKSDILARGQAFTGDPETYKKSMARVLSATAADVVAASKRWLSDGVLVLTVQPFPKYETAKSDVDRRKLPDIGTPPDAPLPATEKATLSNGLKVILARRAAVPVVRLSLLLDAGFAADVKEKPGVASMTMRMLEEGTATRPSLQIADQLATLGANFSASATLDSCSASLSVLKDRLAPALDLYSDLVLHPAFPEKELTRVKKTTVARIAQERVEPVGAAFRVLPGIVYGPGHAYGEPLSGTGTEESVNAMTRADLAAFHDTWVKPNHATLLAVGDITLAELVPALEKAFASWKPGETPKKVLAAVPPRAKDELYLIDRPGSEQSVLIVGEAVAPSANPDEHAFQVFNDAFGGAFVSRVNMNLREDKHWSYGAGSFAVDSRGPRLYVVYAPVQTDKTKESLVELRKEIAGALARPLTKEELKDAKDRLTLTMAGRWETASAVGGALAEIVTLGLPEDFYATYSSKVRAVTPAQTADAAKKFVSPGHQVWVVIGDRAKIEKGIQELGIAEIHHVDADGKPLAP
jgi:zinc protease